MPTAGIRSEESMRQSFPWQRRWAVRIAFAISGFIIVTDLLLLPLHARGHAQWLIGYLDGLSGMLQFPGFLVAINAGLRRGSTTTVPVWIFIVAVNFFMWAVGLRFALRLFFPRTRATNRLPQLPDEQQGPQPAQPHATSRRRFLTWGVRGVLAGAGAVWAYSFFVETRLVRISRRSIAIRDLPRALHGLRIVQLTDIHHGPTLSLDYVRRVIDAANALKPDLILLTGDYVYRSPVYIEPVVVELSRLRASIGVVGVLGNHDWWQDVMRTRDAFMRVGIPLIDNDRRFITPQRTIVSSPLEEGLCLAGVGDQWEDVQLFDAALGDAPLNVPRLLLSHNPDVAEDTRLFRHRVDLMLSGHTHGGQCWVPGLGTPITPSKFGSKYASGLVQGPSCPVFISRGIGTTILPMRFAIPPEIALIDLHAA